MKCAAYPAGETVIVYLDTLYTGISDKCQVTILNADQICRNVGLSGLSEFGSYLHVDSFGFTHISSD